MSDLFLVKMESWLQKRQKIRVQLHINLISIVDQLTSRSNIPSEGTALESKFLEFTQQDQTLESQIKNKSSTNSETYQEKKQNLSSFIRNILKKTEEKTLVQEQFASVAKNFWKVPSFGTHSSVLEHKKDLKQPEDQKKKVEKEFHEGEETKKITPFEETKTDQGTQTSQQTEHNPNEKEKLGSKKVEQVEQKSKEKVEHKPKEKGIKGNTEEEYKKEVSATTKTEEEYGGEVSATVTKIKDQESKETEKEENTFVQLFEGKTLKKIPLEEIFCNDWKAKGEIIEYMKEKIAPVPTSKNSKSKCSSDSTTWAKSVLARLVYPKQQRTAPQAMIEVVQNAVELFGLKRSVTGSGFLSLLGHLEKETDAILISSTTKKNTYSYEISKSKSISPKQLPSFVLSFQTDQTKPNVAPSTSIGLRREWHSFELRSFRTLLHKYRFFPFFPMGYRIHSKDFQETKEDVSTYLPLPYKIINEQGLEESKGKLSSSLDSIKIDIYPNFISIQDPGPGISSFVFFTRLIQPGFTFSQSQETKEENHQTTLLHRHLEQQISKVYESPLRASHPNARCDSYDFSILRLGVEVFEFKDVLNTFQIDRREEYTSRLLTEKEELNLYLENTNYNTRFLPQKLKQPWEEALSKTKIQDIFQNSHKYGVSHEPLEEKDEFFHYTVTLDLGYAPLNYFRDSFVDESDTLFSKSNQDLLTAAFLHLFRQNCFEPLESSQTLNGSRHFVMFDHLIVSLFDSSSSFLRMVQDCWKHTVSSSNLVVVPYQHEEFIRKIINTVNSPTFEKEKKKKKEGLEKISVGDIRSLNVTESCQHYVLKLNKLLLLHFEAIQEYASSETRLTLPLNEEDPFRVFVFQNRITGSYIVVLPLLLPFGLPEATFGLRKLIFLSHSFYNTLQKYSAFWNALVGAGFLKEQTPAVSAATTASVAVDTFSLESLQAFQWLSYFVQSEYCLPQVCGETKTKSESPGDENKGCFEKDKHNPCTGSLPGRLALFIDSFWKDDRSIVAYPTDSSLSSIKNETATYWSPRPCNASPLNVSFMGFLFSFLQRKNHSFDSGSFWLAVSFQDAVDLRFFQSGEEARKESIILFQGEKKAKEKVGLLSLNSNIRRRYYSLVARWMIQIRNLKFDKRFQGADASESSWTIFSTVSPPQQWLDSKGSEKWTFADLARKYNIDSIGSNEEKKKKLEKFSNYLLTFSELLMDSKSQRKTLATTEKNNITNQSKQSKATSKVAFPIPFFHPLFLSFLFSDSEPDPTYDRPLDDNTWADPSLASQGFWLFGLQGKDSLSPLSFYFAQFLTLFLEEITFLLHEWRLALQLGPPKVTIEILFWAKHSTLLSSLVRGQRFANSNELLKFLSIGCETEATSPFPLIAFTKAQTRQLKLSFILGVVDIRDVADFWNVAHEGPKQEPQKWKLVHRKVISLVRFLLEFARFRSSPFELPMPAPTPPVDSQLLPLPVLYSYLVFNEEREGKGNTKNNEPTVNFFQKLYAVQETKEKGKDYKRQQWASPPLASIFAIFELEGKSKEEEAISRLVRFNNLFFAQVATALPSFVLKVPSLFVAKNKSANALKAVAVDEKDSLSSSSSSSSSSSLALSLEDQKVFTAMAHPLEFSKSPSTCDFYQKTYGSPNDTSESWIQSLILLHHCLPNSWLAHTETRESKKKEAAQEKETQGMDDFVSYKTTTRRSPTDGSFLFDVTFSFLREANQLFTFEKSWKCFLAPFLFPYPFPTAASSAEVTEVVEEKEVDLISFWRLVSTLTVTLSHPSAKKTGPGPSSDTNLVDVDIYSFEMGNFEKFFEHLKKEKQPKKVTEKEEKQTGDAWPWKKVLQSKTVNLVPKRTLTLTSHFDMEFRGSVSFSFAADAKFYEATKEATEKFYGFPSLPGFTVQDKKEVEKTSPSNLVNVLAECKKNGIFLSVPSIVKQVFYYQLEESIPVVRSIASIYPTRIYYRSLLSYLVEILPTDFLTTHFQFGWNFVIEAEKRNQRPNTTQANERKSGGEGKSKSDQKEEKGKQLSSCFDQETFGLSHWKHFLLQLVYLKNLFLVGSKKEAFNNKIMYFADRRALSDVMPSRVLQYLYLRKMQKELFRKTIVNEGQKESKEMVKIMCGPDFFELDTGKNFELVNVPEEDLIFCTYFPYPCSSEKKAKESPPLEEQPAYSIADLILHPSVWDLIQLNAIDNDWSYLKDVNKFTERMKRNVHSGIPAFQCTIVWTWWQSKIPNLSHALPTKPKPVANLSIHFYPSLPLLLWFSLYLQKNNESFVNLIRSWATLHLEGVRALPNKDKTWKSTISLLLKNLRESNQDIEKKGQIFLFYCSPYIEEGSRQSEPSIKEQYRVDSTKWKKLQKDERKSLLLGLIRYVLTKDPVWVFFYFYLYKNEQQTLKEHKLSLLVDKKVIQDRFEKWITKEGENPYLEDTINCYLKNKELYVNIVFDYMNTIGKEALLLDPTIPESDNNSLINEFDKGKAEMAWLEKEQTFIGLLTGPIPSETLKDPTCFDSKNRMPIVKLSPTEKKNFFAKLKIEKGENTKAKLIWLAYLRFLNVSASWSVLKAYGWTSLEICQEPPRLVLTSLPDDLERGKSKGLHGIHTIFEDIGFFFELVDTKNQKNPNVKKFKEFFSACQKLFQGPTALVQPIDPFQTLFWDEAKLFSVRELEFIRNRHPLGESLAAFLPYFQYEIQILSAGFNSRCSFENNNEGGKTKLLKKFSPRDSLQFTYAPFNSDFRTRFVLGSGAISSSTFAVCEHLVPFYELYQRFKRFPDLHPGIFFSFFILAAKATSWYLKQENKELADVEDSTEDLVPFE